MLKLSLQYRHHFNSLSLIFALLIFVSCQSSGSSSPSGPEGPTDVGGLTTLQLVKQDILTLVEGTYSEVCNRTVDNQIQLPINSGSAIQISSLSGEANWGFGSINMLQTPSTDFGVVIGHADYMMGSKFDLVDPNTMDRLAVIGVQVSDHQSSGATVTDERNKPELGDLCVDSRMPQGMSADVWGIMNKYVQIPLVKLNCINLKTYKQFEWTLTFTADRIALGPNIIDRDWPRNSENIAVVDFEPHQGFYYSISRMDHNQFTIFLNPDKSLTAVQWLDAESTIVSCNP